MSRPYLPQQLESLASKQFACCSKSHLASQTKLQNKRSQRLPPSLVSLRLSSSSQHGLATISLQPVLQLLSIACASYLFDEMLKRPVRYAVVDAFTDEPFKGNTAAVCLVEDGDDHPLEGQWMQSVAAEFNTPITAFLVRAGFSGADASGAGADAKVSNPRFSIRWFTPVRESELCGHGTLAAAHYLVASGLVECNAIEFLAKSGPLTAKKVVGLKQEFSIELDFPLIPVVKCNSSEIPSIPETLNGASIKNVLKTISASAADLIVELNSSEEVINVHPNIAELVQCAGRGVTITGPAPPGSGYDFFTRFFSPKYGLIEDPVCGSVHCALAPYWGKKLGKQLLTAFMASPRSGTLYLQWDEAVQRVRIRGEAVTIMVGTLVV